MSIIISIEGNIGAGKTTIINEINKLTFNKSHIIILEQVQEWMNIKDDNDNNILELFYSDQQKYGYIFQSYVLFSRLQFMLKTIKDNPNSIIICERSHLTDIKVFAKALFELGKLSSIEWNVYNKWHKLIQELFDIKISGIIYNRCSPSICLERICKRSRNGESDITLDYLNLLHNKHEDWMKDLSDIKILNINGDIDILDNERNQLLNNILFFINSL